MDKTHAINHPPNHDFYRLYRPFPVMGGKHDIGSNHMTVYELRFSPDRWDIKTCPLCAKICPGDHQLLKLKINQCNQSIHMWSYFLPKNVENDENY